MIPDFVRRAVWRVLFGGVVATLVVALAGIVGEQIRFGANVDAARQRVAADVQQEFSSLGANLDRALDRVRNDEVLATAVATRDTTAVRELFDRLGAAETALNMPGAALSVYGPEGRPLAWAGRPEQLPADRING